MGFILKRLRDWQEREKRENERFHQQLGQLRAERTDQVNPLPLEEARRRAEALLADPTKLRCTAAPPGDYARVRALPPVLRAFFSRYGEVCATLGGLEISRSLVGPSDAGPDLIRIGEPGLEHVELAVRPERETVYEVVLEARSYEDEADVEGLDTYTSVYHCLIYYDRERTLLYPEQT